MKVIQVINSLATGGAEKLILDTLPLYREKGIHVDVLLLWDNDCMFSRELKSLNCCTVFTLSQSDNFKDIYNPLHIFKIAKIIKEYDIVHVHLFPAQYFAVIANRITGNRCKLIFTEHSTFNKRSSNTFISFIDKRFYKDYSKIVAISPDVLNFIGEYLPFSKRIVLIPNGVNIKKIDVAPFVSKRLLHKSLSEQDFLLCQVSAFRNGKDQITLIKSLLHLNEHFKLLLVGSGDENEKNKVIKCIADNGLQNRVILLGNRNDIYSIIKSVDLNVLSTKFEGLSLACMESMASGKPFIASDVPGVENLVSGAGILFEYQNSLELASHIKKVESSSSFREKIVHSCLERVKKYDISIMIERHINMYKEVYEAKNN